MTEQTTQAALDAYLAGRFWAEDQLLKDLRADIAARAPRINISPEAGAALATLVHAVRATRVLEVGTLFGYSGTWLARALPEGGHLDTLELSPVHAEAARQWFDRAGLDGKVTVHLGDAGETLATLAGPYDMVFIDADKEGYPSYLDHALRLVRPGGLILADNIHQRGRLAAAAQDDGSVRAIQAYVERIATDPRLQSTVLPLGDGLSLTVVSAP
jgi:caffeoyl-CoA O-methyltransferase